jgi:hypothetical protein
MTIGKAKKKYANSEEFNKIFSTYLDRYAGLHNYSSIDETPQKLLHDYSSSQFHSMWLTYGFNLGRTETFVDLPIAETKENI